jgi:uncharacterized protein
MKLGGRERVDDGAALEELFAQLPVTADWTLGFLTAIGTGPDPIAPTLWVPEIMPGPLAEDPVARAKVELLARLFGAVSETLRTTPEIICPEPDKPAQEAVDFCRGYLRGARMHTTWQSDELATARLRPFEALAEAKASADAVDPERSRLGGYVAGLHAYWQSKRQVVNATPKVGRNEPCPCGSGKKHKKCCLAKQG